MKAKGRLYISPIGVPVSRPTSNVSDIEKGSFDLFLTIDFRWIGGNVGFVARADDEGIVAKRFLGEFHLGYGGVAILIGNGLSLLEILATMINLMAEGIEEEANPGPRSFGAAVETRIVGELRDFDISEGIEAGEDKIRGFFALVLVVFVNEGGEFGPFALKEENFLGSVAWAVFRHAGISFISFVAVLSWIIAFSFPGTSPELATQEDNQGGKRRPEGIYVFLSIRHTKSREISTLT